MAQSSPPSDANLLLLEVRLERHVLSDSLTAYQKGRHVLVPLGELAKLLTIAIRTQPQEGTASGFVLRDERTFHLNAGERVAVVADKKESVDAGLLEVHADDIYVASSLLARWLPVDVEIDLSALSLRLKPREPLPLQLRLERERRGASARAGLYEDPGYPLRDSSYGLLAAPSIDQTFALNIRRSRGQSASAGSYTAFLAGDLLGMESAFFLNAGGEDAGQRFRATLGRNDPGGGLLGPLGARSYAFGSIAVPGFANVARTSPTGNGLRVSNRPLIQPLSFDRHTLQGDLPPGWDVEIYFNDALIGFQQSRPDGKYVFADLPLVYGLNEFRLVFHGPLGQLRVERQSFIFEESLVAPGQFLYHFAQHSDLAGTPRAAAQFDLGLAQRLSASAGLTQLTVGGVERRYSNLGLRAAWQSLFLHGDLVHSEDGGSLAELGGKLRLGGFTLGLRRAAPREFTSEFFLPSTDPVRTRDALRLDGLKTYLQQMFSERDGEARNARGALLRRETEALLSESLQGVERVSRIVRDLKDFSRLDDAEWKWIDLHDGLDSVLNIVANEIKYKAKLVKEYGELPKVRCLPSRLHQVFLNILLNAAQAIEKEGTITLRTGASDGEVRVSISDTGKGIAPEHAGRIFEPFFTTKPPGEGTGLGLSLSYSIVRRYQGRIEVDSAPGRGTTFTVHLPVCPAEDVAAEK